MSAPDAKVYRFGSPQQWATGLLDRLSAAGGGGLTPQIALGQHAAPTAVTEALSGVAIDPYQQPRWRMAAGGGLAWWDELEAVVGPVEVDATVARSPRLLADGRWLWAFSAQQVRRYDADTLDLDRTFDLSSLADPEAPQASDPVAVVDIAGDGCEGFWALVETRDGGAALVRFDGRGCFGGRLALPCGVGPASQIAAVDRGRGLLLLASRGDRLWRMATADGACEWSLALENALPCWTATRLASDLRGRAGLGGPRRQCGQEQWCYLPIDSAGDLLQAPLTDLFPGRAPAPAVADLSVAGDLVCFATDQGLFRLDASDACAAAGSSAVFLSPAIYSPITSNGRGWLRAELDLTLPRGVALEATFASTDDPVVADRVQAAGGAGLPAAVRQQHVWAALADETLGPSFVITGEDGAERQVEIPLFTTNDRWLWLRLELHVPPGAAPPSLRELRVIYPEVSIVQNLPGIFRGTGNDPTGELRRLVGVLETTTQNIDGRIRGVAGELDPTSAQPLWLDHLAQWTGVPWHRALPEPVKRKLLQNAGDLLDLRGRRAGLILLLRCLFGAQVRVTDLTVDHPPVRLGGEGAPGAALPGLLAGVPLRIPTLGGKAVLGRARIACATTRCDPMADLGPALRIEITTDAPTRQAIEPLLGDILADYVPAGLRIAVRWRVSPTRLLGETDEWVLDGDGPGRLGDDSVIGRTVLAGRPGGLGDAGAAMGSALR